jgi:hypothetical protein
MADIAMREQAELTTRGSTLGDVSNLTRSSQLDDPEASSPHTLDLGTGLQTRFFEVCSRLFISLDCIFRTLRFSTPRLGFCARGTGPVIGVITFQAFRQSSRRLGG